MPRILLAGLILLVLLTLVLKASATVGFQELAIMWVVILVPIGLLVAQRLRRGRR